MVPQYRHNDGQEHARGLLHRRRGRRLRHQPWHRHRFDTASRRRYHADHRGWNTRLSWRAITANTAYYSGLFTATNPATQQVVIEYATFSLNAAGYIYAHSTGAGGITKETTDTLEVQYRFAFP